MGGEGREGDGEAEELKAAVQGGHVDFGERGDGEEFTGAFHGSGGMTPLLAAHQLQSPFLCTDLGY